MARTRSRSLTLGADLVAVLLVVALVGLPLAQLVVAATSQGLPAVAHALTAPGAVRAMTNTFLVGVGAAVLAVAIGLGAALVTERSGARGRSWLRITAIAPLLVPPFAGALGWSQAYGPAGFTDHLFHLRVPGLLGPVGVMSASTAEAVPLAYIVIAATLAVRAEPDLERAARAAGASATRAFLTVSLPLLQPALAVAGLITFVSAVNNFAVPAVLGTPGGFATVTTRIYESLNFSADPLAFSEAEILATVLVVLALAVAVTADRRLRVGRAPRAMAPSGPSSRVQRGGGAATLALWAYFGLTAAGPILALVLTALTRAPGLAPVPANWTLNNFSLATAGGHALGALGLSLLLAVSSAFLLVLLGGLVVAVERRPLGKRVATAIALTFAVPGSSLAIAVLIAYGRWLGGSALIILVAYAAKLWALGHRPLAAAADRLAADAGRAARASGASGTDAVRTIVIPLLRPALFAAWVLVFLFAIHELTMSSLLYGPGTETLAVVVLNLQEVGDVSTTSALAVLLTLLTLIPAALGMLALARSARLEAWAARAGLA